MRTPLIYVSGRILWTFSRQNVYFAASTVNGLGAGNMLSGFFVSPISFTAHSMVCDVASGEAAATAYMGVHDLADNGFPGVELATTGQFAVSSAGLKVAGFSGAGFDVVADTPYWLSILMSNLNVDFVTCNAYIAEIGSVTLGSTSSYSTVGNGVSYGSPLPDLNGNIDAAVAGLIAVGFVLP